MIYYKNVTLKSQNIFYISFIDKLQLKKWTLKKLEFTFNKQPSESVFFQIT